MIGLNEGNGHPYSWAAITNGYNPRYMKQCPFPVIPRYLEKQKFPQDQIKGATVTHIWTQDQRVSNHIALSTHIPNVVSHFTDMIGQVDAILLARDDAENHFEYSKPFLDTKLPIYIDKPLAFDVKTAKKIYSLEKFPGQIFTCSALSFAPELLKALNELKTIGKIQFIDAVVVKDWKHYGIHIIEPVLKLLPSIVGIEKYRSIRTEHSIQQHIRWEDGTEASMEVIKDASFPAQIRIFGEKRHIPITFTDTFSAFKNTLAEFILCCKKKHTPPKKDFVLQAISLLEKGIH